MSDPKHSWNLDDGPPPTEEELLAASRLAESLDTVTPTDDADTAALLTTALRVRAARRPSDEVVRAIADRAVAAATRQHRASWWTRAPRLRIAAAAAVVLAAAGVGGGAWMASKAAPSRVSERTLSAVFDAPVEPGAASAPSSRLYDHGLRSYRAALLGGSQ